MPTIDIFKNDAFSVINLTKYVNEQPFIPGLIGKLGIFGESEGVNTTTIAVENYGGTLALIPSSERGAAGWKNKRDTRSLRNFTIPHFKPSDNLKADEILNVRAMGSDSEVEAVESVVQRRLNRMLSNLDTTQEHQRLGAVKGIILESDGAGGSTTRYNLFTEFGITQTSVDFVLGTAGTDILGKCTDVRDAIQEALGAAGGDDIEVHAVVGKTWWKKFISHPLVREAYKYYQTQQSSSQNPLQNDLRYKGFKFGDITFHVYRGTVSGLTFVAASEAHFFPVNVPDLFIERFAPADYLETVGTEGLPRYSKTAIDPMFERYVEIEAQSNPLALCTRPAALVKGTTSD